MTPAIDTHIHLYDPSRPEGVPWPPKTDDILYRRILAPEFHEAVQGLNVASAVIIEASPWPADNDYILAGAHEDPRTFVCVVGHLEPGSKTFESELTRLRRDPLFRGIRIGGTLNVPAITPDLQRLADAGLSLDVLVNPKQWPAVAELASRIPKLRIIVDHLPVYPSPVEGLRALAAAPNIWIKVSGVMRRDPKTGEVPESLDAYRAAIDELWSLFGEQRLVYGSNWPVSNKLSNYAAQINVVRAYFGQKGSRAEQSFFRDNAHAVYRWTGFSSASGA